MYRFYLNIPKYEYESFVENSKYCNLLQSYDWARIKSNWQHMHVGVYQENTLVGSSLILIKQLPLSFTMFYIPKGPILDYTDTKLFDFFFSNLKQLAQNKRCIFIKFDPDICIREFNQQDTDIPYKSETYEIIKHLKNLGCIHYGFTTYIKETIQPRFHMGLKKCDLDSHLPKSTLKSIRKALKKHVEVKEVNKSGLEEFSQIMKMTELRKGVHLRDKDYFEKLLNVYPGAHLFLAYVNPNKRKEELLKAKPNKQIEEELQAIERVCEKYPGKTAIAGGIMIGYGNYCEMLYAGSNEDFANFRPQYLLYYTQFQYAFNHGYDYVTMGGVDGNLLDGLSKFKLNFSPVIVEYIGEFDLPIYKFLYFLSMKLLKGVKKYGAKIRK